MPTAWKEANVTPVFKDGHAACVENYRPISLLCILSKKYSKDVFITTSMISYLLESINCNMASNVRKIVLRN